MLSHNELLERLYNDPETGFVSSDKLYKKAKEIDKTITHKIVKDFYKSYSQTQISSDKRNKEPNFKIASHNPDSWQIDLMFFDTKVIFTAININSRAGYLKLIDSKSIDDVFKAVKDFASKNKVRIITSDNGREFFNYRMAAFVKENGIRHFNTYPGDHSILGKVDRFIRTIKQRLTKIKPSEITQELLNKIARNYNNTYHSSIKAKPKDMKGQVYEEDIDHNLKLIDKLAKKFHVGAHVRYRIDKKNSFAKESSDKWSEAVYEVVGFDGYKVQLRSGNGHTLYKSPNDIKIVKADITEAPGDKDDNIFEAEKIVSHVIGPKNRVKYLVQWKDGSQTYEPPNNLRLIEKYKTSKLESSYLADLIEKDRVKLKNSLGVKDGPIKKKPIRKIPAKEIK